jgi:hypothetical protein
MSTGIFCYTKKVYMSGFAISGKYTKDGKDYKPKTMEELCTRHQWRHRSSKYFKDPLPKNWIYCSRCGTEKLEGVA